MTDAIDDPDSDLDIARTEAEHWRAMADEKSAELRRLKRRPLVRAALALDRRVEPGRRAVSVRWQRWRVLGRRAYVTAGGATSAAGRAKRRAALAAELAHHAPASDVPRTVAIVEPGSAPSESASSEVTADLVCFLPASVVPLEEGWLARLASAVCGDVVAATPTLVHPDRTGLAVTAYDLRVRAEGFDIELDDEGTPVVSARRAGDDVRLRGEPHDVAAASLRGLVVDRNAFVAAGGLVGVEGDADDDVAGIDLCARLQRHGGRVVHVPGAVLFDDRPVRSRAALYRPVERNAVAWRALIAREGPALARAARAARSGPQHARRWVITTAAPSSKIATRWGDWHLAEGLARALRRLGEDVVVQTHDRAESLAARSRDIHLVLRGLAPVQRTSGQRHVLWVISHPESLAVEDCDDADLVLVASTRFAEHLRIRTSTRVEVFLQATDAERFRPGPPDPAHRHPVTVVAKTRGVMRPIVRDALAAGIRPAIYGGGWRGLVDPTLVVADHVDNDRLAVVYRSAGVVLNDHWGTMRAWGFVSNRIFDVLACGTPIISDHLPEIEELLDGAVPTYTSSAELGELVREALEDATGAREVAALGRATVLGQHTFDHRARQLLTLVDEHGMGERGG
ncbi:MAG TPA: glycosyltransferase [Acidimicrobiales bacterium]|nr:glycosyltransferase [Acidimicrobiales bacterium]